MVEEKYDKRKDKKQKKTNWVMTYEINGRRYKFVNVYVGEDGIAYGYCVKTKRWAWLYRDAISHYAKDTDLIPAKRIDSKMLEK